MASKHLWKSKRPVEISRCANTSRRRDEDMLHIPMGRGPSLLSNQSFAESASLLLCRSKTWDVQGPTSPGLLRPTDSSDLYSTATLPARSPSHDSWPRHALFAVNLKLSYR